LENNCRNLQPKLGLESAHKNGECFAVRERARRGLDGGQGATGSAAISTPTCRRRVHVSRLVHDGGVLHLLRGGAPAQDELQSHLLRGLPGEVRAHLGGEWAENGSTPATLPSVQRGARSIRRARAGTAPDGVARAGQAGHRCHRRRRCRRRWRRAWNTAASTVPGKDEVRGTSAASNVPGKDEVRGTSAASTVPGKDEVKAVAEGLRLLLRQLITHAARCHGSHRSGARSLRTIICGLRCIVWYAAACLLENYSELRSATAASAVHRCLPAAAYHAWPPLPPASPRTQVRHES